MSQSELEALAEAEKALRLQLQELQTKKQEILKREAEARAEAERQELLKKPITIHVNSISGGMLICRSEFRPDLLEAWKKIPGRVYKGEQSNGIPLKQWEAAREILEELPFISIEWSPGLPELFDWHLTAPPLEVTIENDSFKLVPGPGVAINLYSIPGFTSEWDFGGRYTWYVPKPEGWRIPPAIEKVQGTVYSEEAHDLIISQIEKRSRLDEIAMKVESDFLLELNGNKLRPFQSVGVEFIDATDGKCILADDTGLGKTWQGLGYAEFKREQNPSFQTLCIVKASNIPNWRREIERLTGETPFQCFTGKPNSYDTQKIMIERAPYVLISYDTMGSYRVLDENGKQVSKKESRHGKTVVHPWVEVFNLSAPDLVILDEAHSIKNPSAYRTKAALSLENPPHVIPMTASPIMNRTDELAPLIKMVQPHLVRDSDHFVRAYTVDGKRPRNVQELHKLMRTFFLRRRKADVMKDLPPINRIERFYDLSPEAKESYEEVLTGIYTMLAEFDPNDIGGSKISVANILSQITRLTQICAADKAKYYTPELAQEITDSANGSDAKVLIFSHWKGTAYAIARRLGAEAVCTVERTPSGFNSLDAVRRDELFEKTRHNPNVRYVVTTSAAREGHNLEYCDWVIFNDPFWTPAAHYQCEGRAYGRVSNPHPIDSYYVVADTEIEKWKFEILAEKLAIFNEVVEGVEDNRALIGSVGMELIKKLKESMWTKGA